MEIWAAIVDRIGEYIEILAAIPWAVFFLLAFGFLVGWRLERAILMGRINGLQQKISLFKEHLDKSQQARIELEAKLKELQTFYAQVPILEPATQKNISETTASAFMALGQIKEADGLLIKIIQNR